MKKSDEINKRLIAMALTGVLLLLSASLISSANQAENGKQKIVEISGDRFSAPPGPATLISPNGVINTGSPTYIWSQVANTTFYCLKVNDSSGNIIINQCYKAEDLIPDVNSRLGVTPSVTLGPGSYQWRILTWNCNGSQLSAEMLFEVCTSTSLPGRATLISPKGTIGTSKPTYVWYPVAGATRYHLRVANTSNPSIIDQWYDATEVISNNKATIKPDVALAPGNYKWWIQTGNCLGDGPWSNYLSFKVAAVAPGKVSLLSPRGLISTCTPTFIWASVPTATEYQLVIENDSAIIFNDTYLAEDITVGYKCYVFSPIILPLDDSGFFWRVQASNDAGVGPWSNYAWFEPVCCNKDETSLAKAAKAKKLA